MPGGENSISDACGGRVELGIGSGSTPGELATYGVGAPGAAARTERLAETLAHVRPGEAAGVTCGSFCSSAPRGGPAAP